jgi:hypothetical protein
MEAELQIAMTARQTERARFIADLSKLPTIFSTLKTGHISEMFASQSAVNVSIPPVVSRPQPAGHLRVIPGEKAAGRYLDHVELNVR